MTIKSNDVTAAALAGITAGDSVWAPPIEPDCLSPEWEREWESSGPQARHNLAYAWLWYLQKDHRLNSSGWRQNMWTAKYRWLAAIQAHIQNEMPDSPQREKCTAIFLRDILSRSTAGSTMINLWFGDTETKSAALIVAGRAGKLEDLGEMKYVAEDIAWDIALSSREPTYLAAARYLSVLSGLEGLFHSEYHTESFPWHMLGQHCAPNLSSRPGIPFTMSIADLKDFVASIEVTITAPILGRLFEHSPNRVSNILCTRPIIPQRGSDGIPEASYAFLSAWLPSQKNTLDACAALGMPMIEACSFVAGMHARGTGMELPGLSAAAN
jgi:hypothetical protein